MKLVQTTLFGVRGECYELKKGSPFGQQHAAGQTPVMNVKRGDPEACEPKRQAERERIDGRSGEASGCGLLVLLAAALACFALAWVIERRGARVRVAWISEYPDPVCERCGKVLDGTRAECAEEDNGK